MAQHTKPGLQAAAVFERAIDARDTLRKAMLNLTKAQKDLKAAEINYKYWCDYADKVSLA